MWSGPKGEQVELLEAVPVLLGRHCRLLHGPADAGLGDGRVLLCGGVSDDCLHHSTEAAVRGSGVRVAFAGVHHPDDQRGTVLLHRHTGAVSRQDVYGGEEAAYLPGPGEVLRGGSAFILRRFLDKMMHGHSDDRKS